MSTLPQPSLSAKRPPRKLPNVARRSREYPAPQAVDQLMASARKVGRQLDLGHCNIQYIVR
jgi:hypothetical protein